MGLTENSQHRHLNYSYISQLKAFKRTLTDDITMCFKLTEDKINQISIDNGDVLVVKPDKAGHSIEANAFVHVVHTLNEAPEPLILQLNYWKKSLILSVILAS